MTAAADFVRKPYGPAHAERKVLWTKDSHEIAVETVAAAQPDCDFLIKLHWKEIANWKNEIPLEPRWEEIHGLEREGRIALITLREAGELIGYSMFVLNIHLHYRSLTVATNDILYVRPDKRKSRLGLQLIKESQKYVKEIGATKITWHMKPHMNFSAILEKLGYTHEELVYGKYLGDKNGR